MTLPRNIVVGSLWNLVGLAAPLLAAAFAIPFLLRIAGPERFGVLALVWTLTGYASLLDLGLGRALTRWIATEGGTPAVGTALAALSALGIAGGCLLFALAAPAAGWMNVSPGLRGEAAAAFRWAAVAVPAVTLTAGLRGILEARQEFRVLAWIRASAGALMFAAPLIAGPELGAMAASLAVVRWGGLAAHTLAARRLAAREFRGWIWAPRQLRPLVSFGGWLTAGIAFSQIIVTADRYVIGASLSAAAVAAYTVPYEIVSRLQVIPAAAVGVAFPALAAGIAGDERTARAIYWRMLWAVGGGLALPCFVLAAWPAEALRLWLGPGVPAESAVVLAILAAGTWINACANLPVTWLHARGKSRLTAAIHLIELPLTVGALVVAVPAYGITGAAAVWTGRVAADAALMFWFAREGGPAGVRRWVVAQGETHAA